MLMLLSLTLLVVTPATALTPDQVRAALKEKKGITYEIKTKFSLKKNDFGGLLVAFASTPYSRLTWVAQTARERFEELTEDDIKAATADTSLCVSTPISERPVQSIVLVPRNAKDPTPDNVIKSAETSRSIHDMYNKLGGQWKEASHTACYPEGLNTEDLDVVVVYQGGKPLRAPFPKNLR
jgi:hypothetical protein